MIDETQFDLQEIFGEFSRYSNIIAVISKFLYVRDNIKDYRN